MLDPRMRLKVFENLHWEPEWIDNVKKKFHRVYDNYYASKETSQPDVGSEVDMLEADRVASAVRLQVRPERPTTSSSPSARQEEVGFEDLVFGPPENLPHQSQMRSRVDFYLEEACADCRADPVVWWKLHAHRFPLLALMAHDHLSVPVSQTVTRQGRLSHD